MQVGASVQYMRSHHASVLVGPFSSFVFSFFFCFLFLLFFFSPLIFFFPFSFSLLVTFPLLFFIYLPSSHSFLYYISWRGG